MALEAVDVATHTPSRGPRRENCTILIDASAGCKINSSCVLGVTVSGSTEFGLDPVSVWRVTDSKAPLASLSNIANRVAVDSGAGFVYTSNVSTTTGMILVRFTSDAATTAAGWSLSWSVVAVPPPQSK